MVIDELTCKICGYKWLPRYNRLPSHCPHCQSHFWKEGKTDISQSEKRLLLEDKKADEVKQNEEVSFE